MPVKRLGTDAEELGDLLVVIALTGQGFDDLHHRRGLPVVGVFPAGVDRNLFRDITG